MESEIIIKLGVYNEELNKNTYMHLINILNDDMFAIKEIRANDKLVFNNEKGFNVKEGVNNE